MVNTFNSNLYVFVILCYYSNNIISYLLTLGERLMANPNDNRTDKEWLYDHYEQNPQYTQAVFVRAIVLAVTNAADALNMKVDIDDDKVLRSLGAKKQGAAVGMGTAAQKNQATVKMFYNNDTNETVDRGGRVIDTYKVSWYNASFKAFNVNGGKPIRLDVNDYLKEAASQVITQNPAGTITPKENSAILEEQILRNKIINGYNDQSEALLAKTKEMSQALFKFEHAALLDNAIAVNNRPSELGYPKRKHTGISDQQLDSMYNNALPTPEGYAFLSHRDIDLDPRMKALEWDAIGKAAMEVTIRTEQLETTAANLAVADKLVSGDDEHPLLIEHKEKYGSIRELDEREAARLEFLKGKKPFGTNIFVGAVNVADLDQPNPPIVTGQLFTSTLKKNVKNLSISNAVNVIAGEPSEKIDGIFLSEGIATAASLKEMIDNSPEYKGKNIVVLSAFDANNFLKVGMQLHHQYPDVPVYAVGDNDVQIRVTTGDRPIMAYDDGYSYITREGGTIAASDLPAKPSEQKALLATNAGADVCYELNKYILDNPNRDEEGNPIKPVAIAFVANKGDNITDYLLVQASPNKDGKTPLEDRLKSPKADLNDLVEVQKSILRHDLNNEWKAMDVKPTKEEKMVAATTALQKLASTLITEPIAKVTLALGKHYEKRLARGDYDVAPELEQSQENEQANTATQPSKGISTATQTPEQIKTAERITALEGDVKQHLKELFKVELEALNQLSKSKPSNDGSYMMQRELADYPIVRDKYPHLTGMAINELTNRSLAIPDDFEFLSFDPKEQVTEDVLKKRLETVVAHIYDRSEDNKLVDLYMQEHGEPRDLTDEELDRTQVLDSDPAQSQNVISGKKLFVPSFDLNSLKGSNGAEISGGQIHDGNVIRDIDGMSTVGQVNLIDGDPSEEIKFLYITSSIEDGVYLANDMRINGFTRGQDSSNAVVISALSTENAIKLAERLHGLDLDHNVTFVMPNDQDVRVDHLNKAVLTDGEYTYIGKDGNDISVKDIHASAPEMQHQVEKNKGAMAAKTINQFVVDNQQYKASDHVERSRVAAIVVNKGESITDYIVKPQAPDMTGDRPKGSTDGLLNPKAGYADIAKSFTAALRQNVINRFAGQYEAQGEEFTNRDIHENGASPRKIANYLFDKLVSKPDSAVRDALNDIVRDRKNEGYYEPAQKREREMLEQTAKKLQESDRKGSSRNRGGSDSKVEGNSRTDRAEKPRDKYEEVLAETNDLATRLVSNHVNNDIMNAFEIPSADRKEPAVKQQKPQEDLTNMPRPSPR